VPIKWKKRLIDTAPFEACSVFDVNNDGIRDIVSGEYWYEGPDFVRKHKICDIQAVDEYHDDFSDYPLDVDGDGYTDIITGAWWGQTLRWRRNPGAVGGPWETFDIDYTGCIETIRYCDIDGCGLPEIFPNTPGAPQAYYKLIVDKSGRGTGKFSKYVIGGQKSGHGMGFGDINGNGRMDVILNNGWLEQPENPQQTPWIFHQEFSLGSASVPILSYDVTGNGRNDIIVGQAHGYGFHWYEQQQDAQGNRNWFKHIIDMECSQYHDLQMADVDGDGELELITGKRYRAHNDHDPGASDPLGIYYFKLRNGRFEKHIIDYGPAGEASGCGIYFWVEDLTGNGYPDIVAPGKDGLYLFENLGSEGDANTHD